MIVVGRKAFLELPDGIAFAKYTKADKHSCDDYEGLCIKIKTYRHDEIPHDPFDFGTMQLGDISTFSRDGMFEENQEFAIYNEEDIDKIIYFLNESKKIITTL